MGRKRAAKYTVNIRTQQFGDGDLPGFLDMLRYEGSQVTGWNRTEQGFSVDLRVDDAYRFVPDRWKSFGIVPTQVDEDVY